MVDRFEATLEPARSRRLSLAGLGAPLRAGLLLNRWPLVALALTTPVIAYLMSLSPLEPSSARWVWLEVVFLPFAAVIGADAFVGRYERGEMEMLLARRSARRLFFYLVLPSTLTAVAASMALSLMTTDGGPLAAAARAMLVLGLTHVLVTLTKSRWFGLVVFSLWWLLGLTYMTAWAGSSPVVAMWHPMRLSGGDVNLALEGLVLAVGIALLVAAWLAVGQDKRWLN